MTRSCANHMIITRAADCHAQPFRFTEHELVCDCTHKRCTEKRCNLSWNTKHQINQLTNCHTQHTRVVAILHKRFVMIKLRVGQWVNGTDNIYLHVKFGEDTSTGGRVMAIYVFSKWRSAAILDFCGSKIWRYFCFRDVGFSLWAKFCANMRNCDRVMAV